MFMEDQTLEDDISASIDFNLSPSNFSVPHDHHQYYNNNQEPFTGLTNQIPSLGDHEGPPPLYLPMVAAPECLPPLPAYNIRLRSNTPACTLADPVIGPYLSSNNMNNASPFSFDNSWLFTGGATGGGLSFLGNDHLSNQEMESQGDNGPAGFYMHDISVPRVFNCSNGDLQVRHTTNTVQYSQLTLFNITN